MVLEQCLNHSQERARELDFDARLTSQSGGIDNINETLTFKTNHNIISGQPLVYDRNNNPPLVLGQLVMMQVHLSLELAPPPLINASVTIHLF